ncbi:MAG: EthD domain-containing protein [Waterburya sp.]
MSNYAIRDRKGTTAFYVLLKKRPGITLKLFDDYWRNVHGPVCARLPGQYQYWQFHVEHSQNDLWPIHPGIEYNLPPEDQFDGIAELTFTGEKERQTWFQAAAILMDDEHNLFNKAIGYNTSSNNSQTYVDRLTAGDPNGKIDCLKLHVMVRKADRVSLSAFREYMSARFATAIVQSNSVLKFRLHLFEEVDNSRPDAGGVVHLEPSEKQYHAAFEIAFSNTLEREKFFASTDYKAATENISQYVKQISPFPERTAYTFVYAGAMTLAGQRSSTVAELITEAGALNQLQENIVALMSGQTYKSNEGQGGTINLSSSNSQFLVSNTQGETTMLETLPGTASELAQRLFARGEAFDAQGFIEFFTDTPLYQFGNYPPCFSKAEIEQSIKAFFSQVTALYHDIKMMWEVGDTLFVEMDVTYWRKDGSVVNLPCCDIFRLKDGKFSELRIFMDANPVGDSTIPIPNTSSVMTLSGGRRYTSPEVMKNYFINNPEGQKRASNGNAPKWSKIPARFTLVEV